MQLSNLNRIGLFPLFLFICLFPHIVTAQNEKVDKLIRKEMQERRIPGLQVAVVKQGKIVFLKSYGIADIEQSTPVTNESIFSINSCTKPFIAVALMQLVVDGKVDLLSPVSKYLDSLPVAWQAVTIMQLLAGTSGIPGAGTQYVNENTGQLIGISKTEYRAKALTMPMLFPPGERSGGTGGTAYDLVQKIIAKYEGKSFTEMCNERQQRPAGMRHTYSGDSRDIIPKRAETYQYVKSLSEEIFPEERLVHRYEQLRDIRDGGSMYSTAEDIANWIIALQQNKILKNKEALSTLWTAAKLNNGKSIRTTIGGWDTNPDSKYKVVGMEGGGRSAYFIYPEFDLAVIVLTNLLGSSPHIYLYEDIAACYNQKIASDPLVAFRIKLRERGYEHAIEIYQELKKRDTGFQIKESDLNGLGYWMLGGKPKKEALEIFKLNAFLYPESANVYDSMAEAYEANGNRELAIKNYKKSLELNPGNNNAIQQLKKLDPNFK